MLEQLLVGFNISEKLGYTIYVVLWLIVFDVVVGMLASAKEGKLNSIINYDGLIRKAGEILAVFFLSFVDGYLQMDGVIITTGAWLIIMYETMSIIENFSRVGVNLDFLTQYFDDSKVKRKGKEKGDKK